MFATSNMLLKRLLTLISKVKQKKSYFLVNIVRISDVKTFE